TNKNRERKTTKNSLNGLVQIQIPQAKAKEYGYEYNWLLWFMCCARELMKLVIFPFFSFLF
ncbi:MAG: hypothetical protein Q8807_04195, partial ['Waltheria sp.' little leaf phytoplasma]|nr:hypothetical protein ['Waltheria sp.' little leaf phytoplasma]